MATYTKVAGSANTKGTMYEIKMAALLHLRAVNSGKEFQLAQNVAGAGALDDIVFRVRSPENDTSEAWLTWFFQLKHKEDTDKFTLTLQTLTDPKSPFCIVKYFESFGKIKLAMASVERNVLFDGKIGDSTCVLFTNARVGGDLGTNGNNVGTLGFVEEILDCRSGIVVSFRPQVEVAVYKAVFDFLENDGVTKEVEKAKKALEKKRGKNKKSVETNGSDIADVQLTVELAISIKEQIVDFLKHFHLFCARPSVGELDALIEDELRAVETVWEKYEIEDTFYKCYMDDFEDWCDLKTGVILEKDGDLVASASDRAYVESCSLQEKNACRVDVSYLETCVADLKTELDSSPQVHVECSESSCSLSCSKVLQAVNGLNCLFFRIESFERSLDKILSEMASGKQKTLVIVVRNSDKENYSDNLDIIKRICTASLGADQSVVILSYGINQLVVDLAKESFKSVADTFQFSQLTKKTRDVIFNTNFRLQNSLTSLTKLAGEKREEVGRVLDACSVVELVESRGNIISIGPELKESIPYYVPRQLDRTWTLKQSLFRISDLSESMTVIHSSMEEVHSILLPTATERTTQQVKDNLLQFSALSPDEENPAMFTGAIFPEGAFECSYVGLRSGQDDEITGLRIRSRNNKQSPTTWFLFLNKAASEQDVSTLSALNNTKHFLSLKDGTLHWTKSNSRSNMESIRIHILDESKVTSLSQGDKVTDKVFDKVTDVKERLVLICAEPGMGKSMLLTHLAARNKGLPHLWVILVSLNDHTETFANREVYDDALGFLLDATKFESPFREALFKIALEVIGNVVILLDGFDEIAPTYITECCGLLSSILRTKANKVWITSRNSMKEKLENHLSTLATKLRKFTDTDQRDFLKLYWKAICKLDANKLNDLIDRLLSMTSHTISVRETDFMGVPLQMQMMAEVFKIHVTGAKDVAPLPENLDLLQLFDRFVENKVTIYAQDKLHIKPSGTNYILQLNTCRVEFHQNHMRASLLVIMARKDLKSLRLRSIAKQSTDFFENIRTGADKTGIIDSMAGKKPRFIHRVFAEYFVAKWFAEHIEGNSVFLENNLYTANYGVIRNIFDRILAKYEAADFLQLQRAVLDENIAEIKTLLQQGIDVNCKDRGGRTALHLAASFCRTEDTKENERRSDILDLIIGGTTDGNQQDEIFKKSPLWYARTTQCWRSVDKLLTAPHFIVNTECIITAKDDFKDPTLMLHIFQNDLVGLVKFYLDEGLDVDYTSKKFNRMLLSACEYGCPRIFELLIQNGADIERKPKEVSCPLLIATDNGHLSIVKLLQEAYLASPAGASMPSRYVNQRDKFNDNAIHYATENGRDDIASYLLSQGADPRSGRTVNETLLHHAARHQRAKVVDVLLRATSQGERADYVNCCNDSGDSAVHCASGWGPLESLKLLVKAGGKITQVNRALQTPLMRAAEGGHRDITEYILNMFDAGSVGEDLSDKIGYINMKDKAGNTALDLAYQNNRHVLVSYLISQGAEP